MFMLRYDTSVCSRKPSLSLAGSLRSLLIIMQRRKTMKTEAGYLTGQCRRRNDRTRFSFFRARSIKNARTLSVPFPAFLCSRNRMPFDQRPSGPDLPSHLIFFLQSTAYCSQSELRFQGGPFGAPGTQEMDDQRPYVEQRTLLRLE